MQQRYLLRNNNYTLPFYLIVKLTKPILFLIFLFLSVNSLSAAELAASCTSKERYGGHIIWAASSDPRSFNLIIAKEASTTSIIGIMFEGLTETDGVTLEIKPALAQSWSYDQNGLIWEFKLRRDVFWSDGERFNADDVVFTFNSLIYNDQIPSSARDIFTIEGKKIEVEKIDDFTVRFTLPKKFVPFLRSMSQEILPQHVLKDSVDAGKFSFTWGTDTDPQKIIGTGPFLLSEYLPGEKVVLLRNPRYYKKDREGNRLPYLEKIIFLIVGNQDAALLRFLDNELDSYGLRGKDYPLLKPKEKERDFTVYNVGPTFSSNFIVFNQNRGISPTTNMPYYQENKLRWFTDLNFRRAVAHAIDKKMIIQILMNGFGTSQNSPVSPSAENFYTKDVVIYDYDLDKARNILAEAGYRDRDGDGILEDVQGEKIEFNLFTAAEDDIRIQISAMIRNDLKELGMKVNFLPLEFNSLVQRLVSTYDWDAVVIGLTGGIEPHFGKNVWNSKGRLHMWYPAQDNPATAWEERIDEIFDLAAQEFNQRRRKKLYDEWQRLVSENLPLIYTVLGDSMFAVRNKFGNFKPTSFGGPFHNIEEIYIIPKD
ncbi:MAG TPA: ABC transporter substrate-binding protein [Candidatus Omnitrophica bacterium]|nr:ABC transporter substrate-binding protein [Candidatus Omnitrophota bacterium]